MRHVVAALAVIVVSFALALQWLPEAQAKKAKDPGAALEKSALNAAKKHLTSYSRRTRAHARSTVKQFRAATKAVRSGRELPSLGLLAPRKNDLVPPGTDGVNAARFIIRLFEDHLLELGLAAEEADQQMLRDQSIIPFLQSPETASRRRIGSGGPSDVISRMMYENTQRDLADVSNAAQAFVVALKDVGIEITNVVPPPATWVRLLADTNESIPQTLPAIGSVVGFGSWFNGTVRLPMKHVVGDATTALRIQCSTPSGDVSGTCPVDYEPGALFGRFACSVSGTGIFRIALINDCECDCPETCCPPLAQCWAELGAGGGGGGGGNADFPTGETVVSYRKSGDLQNIPVLRSVELVYSGDTLQRLDVQFEHAFLDVTLFRFEIAWPTPPPSMTPTEPITIDMADALASPRAVVTVECRDEPGVFYSSADGALDGETVLLTPDRDMTEFSAGAPDIVVRGTVTCKAPDGRTLEIDFNLRIHNGDVERSN